MLKYTTSVCTSLPDNWTGVTTGKEFPVGNGTRMSVWCEEPYINWGSGTVTCNTYKGDDFSYSEEPYCILSADGITILLSNI